MVASELGFRQMLPRKRDSIMEDQLVYTAEPQTNGAKLDVPQIDFSLSRSASPSFEAMSSRIDTAGIPKDVELTDELQLTPMGARVAC
jgi:glucosamine-6-phosphate deaminase